MGSRAYPTEDFGTASWAGLVSEARAYDTDTLPAAARHDERVKKSTPYVDKYDKFETNIQLLRWLSWSKAPN